MVARLLAAMSRTSAAQRRQEPLNAATQRLEPPKVTVRDVLMILLALVSVTLVLLDIFFRPFLYAWGVFGGVVLADFLITLVFAGEFVYQLDRKQSVGRLLRDRWFDLIGLVPLAAFVVLEATLRGVPLWPALTGEVMLLGAGARAGGLLRLFRFVRVVRIVQAFSRFLRATNMTFGEQVTKRVFDKYRRIIVAELTTPIMVAGISVTQEIVIRMKFLEAAGKSLDAKRPEIHAAVLEALKKNNVPENVLAQPFVAKVVRDVESAVVNTMVETLTGPELNKLVQEMIVEVMENFKQQLQSPEGKAMLKNMGAAPPEQPLSAPA